MYWQDAPSLSHDLIHQPRLGLITDMDGTISPIVEKPDDAQITPRSRELLHQLHAGLTLVAVVSGRALDDVRQRVGLPELVYVGNHGMERWKDGQIMTPPEVQRFRPALEAAAQTLQPHLPVGAWIEDKGVTLSIHYRQTADPEKAAARLLPAVQAVSDGNGLRCFQGRMIFELRPPLDINKGSIFASLVHDYALDGALYLGDDTTDADALLMARQMRENGQCQSFGIGVESDDMPAIVRESSDFLADGIAGVESLLAWLLTARRASST